MSEANETPEVEEVNPLEMIQVLEADLQRAQTALMRIIRINPANFPGGPSNKYFGKRFQQALELAQKEAANAILDMESHVVSE